MDNIDKRMLAAIHELEIPREIPTPSNLAAMVASTNKDVDLFMEALTDSMQNVDEVQKAHCLNVPGRFVFEIRRYLQEKDFPRVKIRLKQAGWIVESIHNHPDVNVDVTVVTIKE